MHKHHKLETDPLVCTLKIKLQVRIWEVKPAYDETEITRESINKYKVEIAHGRTSVFDTFLRGYMDKDQDQNNVLVLNAYHGVAFLFFLSIIPFTIKPKKK